MSSRPPKDASTLRLSLFAPNLCGGGAEKTLARLATHWADQGHDVTLITLAPTSPDDFSLPSRVRRIGLNLTADSRGLFGAVRGNLRRIAALRAAFQKSRPNVVVSFIEQANVLALLAARSLGVPVVISERTDPAHHVAGRSWDFLRRRLYRRCETLVVLTDEIAAHVRPLVRGRPVVVIPNGIAASPAPVAAASATRQDFVIAIGRLDAAKGFDRLIDAFAEAAERHPAWKLLIVGEGPQRLALEQQIEARELQDRIELTGRKSDPLPLLHTASLFALPSRYEGFPNALLEAMAAGVPAVAFDGPAAVRQIIRHGTDGLLVPEGNLKAFAAALEDLLQHEDRRSSMGCRAREVVSRFSLDAFLERWDQVVASAANQKISQPS